MQDESFAVFVRSSQGHLLRFACLLAGGDTHAAADLTQDALIEVGRRWRRVGGMEHPLAYTKKVMSRRYFRTRHNDRRELPDGTVDAVGVGGAWESPTHTALWTALMTLPPRQRAVIVLRYYEDLSEAAIAEQLNCSRGTVKSQASRALASLRSNPMVVTEGKF